MFINENLLMIEHQILLESVDPLDIYGYNNIHIDILKEHFPRLKIIARGDMIKLQGTQSDITDFENKFALIVEHYFKFGKLTGEDIIHLISEGGEEFHKTKSDQKDVIVHGNNGMSIKARTVNQKRMVKGFEKHDLIFAVGPAGTGKTYTAVALAVMALKNKEVKRIVLTRPAVEAGENLGFLPGDLKEKLDPYLRPLYDALRDMIPAKRLADYLEDGTIEIAPLAFMRGRTLNNSCVILDEAQNATESQLKMFLTRMGETSKFIVTGDITQIDLPKSQSSGLIHVIRIMKNIHGIDFIFLDEKDVIRHKLVTEIINAYQNEKK